MGGEGYRMQEEGVSFSPAEICEWFDIPRTTLFRWEDDGLIRRAERKGPRAERVYRREHVQDLLIVVRERMEHELDLAERHDPYGAFPPPAFLERLYLIEFFADEDPLHGLRQLRGLARQRDLRPETLRRVVEVALSCDRGDALRAEIWRFLLEYEERARK